MSRLIVVDQDKTTTGGTVRASGPGSIHGKKIARESDPVDCPACGKTGHIVCVGSIQRARIQGKPVALQDDLCHCACQPMPHLVVLGHSNARQG